jgi:iron complex outermembrane recepter protein
MKRGSSVATQQMTKAVLAGAVLACSLSPSVPAFAENAASAEGLQEIVVTAQKREENLQDVPISITALTGEAVQEHGFIDIQELGKFVPNFFTRNNLTGQQIIMRGVGTGVDNEGFEQAVAQFVDGVYYGRATLDQNEVFDVDRVEAVRGPQPIFAGQSATAGVISVINRLPGKSWQGNATAAYGKFKELSIDGAVGGPVSDTFGIRLSGRYYELPDTDYRNYNGQAVGTKQDSAMRLMATWSPSSVIDFTFKLEHQNIWNNGEGGGPSVCELRPQYSRANGFLFPGFPSACALDVELLGLDLNNRHEAFQGGLLDARAALDQLNLMNGGNLANPVWGYNSSPGVTGMQVIPYGLNKVKEFSDPQDRLYIFDVFMGNFVWRLGGGLNLSSTTSFMRYHKHYDLDPDYSAYALFTDHRAEYFKQWSQEFRLTSPVDQKISWMLGGYYEHHDLDTTINIFGPWTFGAPFLPAGSEAVGFGGTLHETSKWASVFAAATWHINDKFRANFGGRYQNVDKDGTLPATYAYLLAGASAFSGQLPYPGSTPATGTEKDSKFDPEVSLQLDLADGVMAYVKYAKAFKAGGFVMSPIFFGGLPNPFTYKPENAEGYETGIKSTLFDHHLDLNVDLYYTKYTDQQVSVYDSPSNSFITANAGQSHTQGLEFDGRWLVTTGFTIGFNGTLGAEAKYDKFEGASCNSLEAKQEPAQCAVGVSRDGVDLPFSSKWSVGINPNYQFPVGSDYKMKVDLNFLRNSGYNNADDEDPRNHQPAYSRVDARLAIGPSSGSWEFGFYGRNLTDERILLQNYTNFASTSLDQTIRDAWGPNLDRGISYGVQLTGRFGK